MAVWTPGLTKEECYQIERVQKCALHVILGEKYLSYDQAIRILEVDKLMDRRAKLCLNFARRAESHPKYANWFHPAEDYVPPNIKTRNGIVREADPTKYTPVPYRTDRYRDSPIPFLTDMLNMHYALC